MEYECQYCEKIYKRKTMYDKHILICKINCTSLRDIEKDKDSLDEYDNKTLSQLVLLLYKRVDELEKRQKNNVDKNLNIINWLNENEKPTTSFKCWIQTIEVNNTTIHNIIKNDYMKGVIELIDSYIYESDIPIKAFERKKNELYIYENDKWSIMNQELLNYFANALSRNIMNVGINVIMTDKTLSNELPTNVKKLNGGNFKNDKICSTIKKDIYDKIKIYI